MIGLATLMAALAVGGGEAAQARNEARPTPVRAVMSCDTDARLVRAFRREHGSAPVFMTADQVLRARESGERWTAPRCMTEREHARLGRLLQR
jgi:predicted dehydrogenase